MFSLPFPREYFATELYSDYNSRAVLNAINIFGSSSVAGFSTSEHF